MLERSMRFDILYHFSNGPLHVIETKRLDLPDSAGAEQIYQWHFVDDKSVKLLTFGSMSLSPQRRTFEEGAIQFDLVSCTGRLFGKDFELTRQEVVGASLRESLAQGLRLKEKGP